MVLYPNVTAGTFLSRPNRFIARAELAGREETVHVKNTGRCRELLVPGARVILARADDPRRKTRFDLVAVWKGDTLINMDSQAPNAAARELLATGYENFAFVHPPEGKKWSELRERGFAEALALHGKSCAAFRPSGAPSGVVWMKGLRRFLAELKKPCAVFAANDKTAEGVLAAAALEGLGSPDDIAVTGVDNYEPICEHTTPMLTSVAPDFRRGGRLAATMLLGLAMGKGSWRGSRVQTFGPLRVVRRASTRILAMPDRAAAAALDLIRREACNGLQAARVAKAFPCSRRQADNRFRRATGRSILEEIHAVQLERAKQLLRDTSVQLKAISDFCGFKNANSLRKFFLRETGMTMSDWRLTSQ